MTAPARKRGCYWQPDSHLPFAAQRGTVVLSELSKEEGAWLVAVLAHDGISVAMSAKMLNSTPSLVEHRRAEPVAVLTRQLLAEKCRRVPLRSLPDTSKKDREIESLKKSRAHLIEQLASMRAVLDRVTCPTQP